MTETKVETFGIRARIEKINEMEGCLTLYDRESDVEVCLSPEEIKMLVNFLRDSGYEH